MSAWVDLIADIYICVGFLTPANAAVGGSVMNIEDWSLLMLLLALYSPTFFKVMMGELCCLMYLEEIELHAIFFSFGKYDYLSGK